jgi:hypothetical protein
MRSVGVRKGMWLAIISSAAIVGLAAAGIVATSGCGGGDGRTIHTTWTLNLQVRRAGAGVADRRVYIAGYVYSGHPSQATSFETVEADKETDDDGYVVFTNTFDVSPGQIIRIEFWTSETEAEDNYHEWGYREIDTASGGRDSAAVYATVYLNI